MPNLAAIALDIGSTSIKAGLLDANGELHGVVSRTAPASTIEGASCEGDALAYAEAAEVVLAECLAQTDERPPLGLLPLGLCCQRSSFLLWERETGQPVTPLISWQDGRGAAACEALREHEEEIRELAGLPLTPYYMGPKLRVLLGEHPDWRERLAAGDWLAGTLDSFLIWRWSGVHATDASIAARTLLMDVRRGQWSARLCELFGIPMAALPKIRLSTSWALPLRNGLTLQASVADQSAALYAGVSDRGGEVLVNLGTGGFALLPLLPGKNAPPGYLQTLLWQDEGGMHFAVEGTLNSISAALAPYPAAECRIGDLARDDIHALSEPSGLGAPYFRKELGLAFSASVEGLPPPRIAALRIEGVAFRVARMLEEWNREFGVRRVCLSGGMSNLLALRQAIAACAPYAEIMHLAQSEAGLSGAGRLAAGMPATGGGRAGKVDIIQDVPKLFAKYVRWKAWLDELLRR